MVDSWSKICERNKGIICFFLRSIILLYYFSSQLTWQSWKITVLNRKYIFKWLEFSIVMSVFRGVPMHTVKAGLCHGRVSQNTDTGVSENGGTPKSSILIVFSIINHPFWGTIILGNPRTPKLKNNELDDSCPLDLSHSKQIQFFATFCRIFLSEKEWGLFCWPMMTVGFFLKVLFWLPHDYRLNNQVLKKSRII